MRSPQNPTFAEGWRDLRADYNMAKTSRYRRSRTGVSGAGRTGDHSIRSESGYLRMMELARDMARNDCVIGQLIDRAVTNMIQEGITLDPQTGDDGLDTAIKDRRADYCEDADQCDMAGELTYPEMTRLALRQTFVDGDIFGLPTPDGPLQLVEGHRPRTPNRTTRNVVHGVLLDEYRRRKEYWITKDEVDPNASNVKVSEITQYPARDKHGNRQVFHLYDPKRVSQTRGVTVLAPIVELAGFFEDIMFARLIQQQVVSCFAVFRNRQIGWEPGADSQRGERSTETLADGSARSIEGYAPGMDVAGEPGETLTGFSPNVPNPEFFEFVKLILTLIGVNLGMPLILVLMDAAESNFSAWRGAMLQAQAGFRRNQHWLIARWLRPDHLRLVRRWMAEDSGMRVAAEKSTVNPFGHRWNLPSWPHVQPREIATADFLRVRNAQTSRRRLAAESSMEFDELSTEICEDNGMLIAKACATAEKLNKDFPNAGITWRDVSGLPPPEGVKVSIGDGGEESPESPAKRDESRGEKAA